MPAQHFRGMLPAALALPIFAAVAHVLICVMDHGYLLSAITYIPANLLLVAIRVAIHRFAEQRRAPTLYANIWLGLHVIGSVSGVYSSLTMAAMQTVPAVSSVSVGCLAAIWASACSVEASVLQIPLGYRLMGHASVLAAHMCAPPMSEFGQPSETLLIGSAITIGDVFGGILEACLVDTRSRAFLAGQQAAAAQRSALKRVSFDATSHVSQDAKLNEVRHASKLNTMISASLAAATAGPASAATTPRAPSVSISDEYRLTTELIQTLSHRSGSGGGTPLAPASLDEQAFLAFHSCRQMPIQIFMSAVSLSVLIIAPAAAFPFPISPASRQGAAVVIACLIAARIAAHRLLSPTSAQRAGSVLVGILLNAVLLAAILFRSFTPLPPPSSSSCEMQLPWRFWVGRRACVPEPPPSVAPLARGTQAMVTLLLCGSMHVFTLSAGWRAGLITASATMASNWPALQTSSDRLTVWAIMHLVSTLIAWSSEQYARQRFQQLTLDTSPSGSDTSNADSVKVVSSPTASLPSPSEARPTLNPFQVHVGAAAAPSAPLASPFSPLPLAALPAGVRGQQAPATPAPFGAAPSVDRATGGTVSGNGSPGSPSRRARPSLGAVALKPHALGKIQALEPPTRAHAQQAEWHGSENGEDPIDEWRRNANLQVTLLSVRAIMNGILAVPRDPIGSAWGYSYMIGASSSSLTLLAIRLLCRQMKDQKRARDIFQSAFVVESWAFALYPWATWTSGIFLKRDLFIAGQAMHPILVASAVPSWTGRIAVFVPRAFSFLRRSLSSGSTTPVQGVGDFTPLESLLVVVAYCSGILVHYFGTLTRRLARQNAVRFENAKLRDKLRATQSAVVESREHIRMLQQMVGAGVREQELIERIFDADRLPRLILERRVRYSELQLAQVLGQGCFGRVCAGLWSGTEVACKVMHHSRLNEYDLHVALRSAQAQLSLPAHPNILRLHGMAWNVPKARVIHVMELCHGGTLGEALERAAAGEDAGEELAWRSHKLPIAAGVARGLAFLHGRQPPITHRDLKPENVLLSTDRRHAKIADLGLCRELSSDLQDTPDVGTPLFTAPEALGMSVPAESYNERADIWSFGCLLTCIHHNRKLPYELPELLANESARLMLASGQLKPSVPASSPVHALVRDACQPVALRPAAAHLAEALEKMGVGT